MPLNISPGGPLPIPYPNIGQDSSSSAPPAVPRPIPKELLAAEFQTILARLGEKFGSRLKVNPTDPEWVEISVENVSAVQLQNELQNARNTLFGTAAAKMQVIQPTNPTGSSIFLHLLTEPNWGDIARVSGK